MNLRDLTDQRLRFELTTFRRQHLNTDTPTIV